MRVIKSKLAPALIAAAWTASHSVLAQVQPLTDFRPIETYRKVVSCSTTNCNVTLEQFFAMGNALRLYKVDMPSVKQISLQVGIRDSFIEITIFPENGSGVPKFGVPGGTMAITYTFDSSGSHMVKKNYNR